jgi:glucose/arabinose dehydrogenase
VHRPRTARTLIAAALVAALATPAQAAAADTFVGASTPGASDAGACDSPAAPCATIQAAVDKSEGLGGGDVHVVANPDGRTTDTYDENVVLDGSAPVNLIGAGRWANGTLLEPAAGTPLDLAAGTAARSLLITAPTGSTGVTALAGSTLDDALVEATGGTGYDGGGRVQDSRLVGQTGAHLNGARLVRTTAVGTMDGLVADQDTSELLQVAVLPRTQDTTGDIPPTGDALRVGGGGVAARVEMRHVTVTGFPTRLRLDGRTASATLQAVNATLADTGGTDLQLQGAAAGAKLRTVNRSPSRTTFTDGAGAGQLKDTDPVDLVPDLTPDGNLFPSSALIDRGTPAGLFNGDPDNKTDINGAPRLQGAAPDIGADEAPPTSPTSPHWVSLGSSFLNPVWTASPPDDLHRVFVVSYDGLVKVIKDGVLLSTPALDIQSKVGAGGGGGFLSIAFPPDFGTTHHVYGFYSRKDDPATPEVETRGDIVICEWTMDPSNPNRIDPTTQRQVMLIPHGAHSHYGGTIAFGPDGYLYISTGDGDSPPNPSQDLSSPLGKILRIDPHESGGQPYTVPPDNPYVNDGDPSTLPEIWARGLRNPFRMGFDIGNGDLWIGDVGHRQYEELNLMRGADGRDPGANFGWQVTEGNVIFQSGDPVTAGNAPPDYVAPVVVHRHDEGDHSITAGTVDHDPTIPGLAGQFLYADFFRGVTRATQAAPGGVSFDHEVQGLAAVPGVTSYTLDPCNRIYVTQLNFDVRRQGSVQRLTTTGQCVPSPDACTVLGTAGNDTLTGTPGDDVICGLGGNDKLIGLGGDDLLSGGDGNDTLVGGAGDDAMQGGDGSDFADYSARTQPVTVTVGTGADDGTAGEADDVQVDVERVNGGSGDDNLFAGPARARLIGLGGADSLHGGAADDMLDGRAGDDQLDGAGGRDTLLGGDDNDDIQAADGRRDSLVCGPGADTHTSDPIDVVDPSCE